MNKTKTKNLNNFNSIRTLKFDNEYVSNIIILNDKRLCSCSNVGKLIIYNNNNYNPDIIIDKNSLNFIGSNSYHTQLSNNNIVICSNDYLKGMIKIVKILQDNKYTTIQEIFLENYAVNKVLEFNGDKLITCCSEIKIWEKENNNYICSNTITISDDDIINILKINDKELVSCEEKHIKFLNIKNNFQLITHFEFEEKELFESRPTFTCSPNSMCLKDNYLFVGGRFYLSVLCFNIKNHQLIFCDEVKIFDIGYCIDNVNSIILLKNGNILVGCHEIESSRDYLIECKLENNEVIKANPKLGEHFSTILGMVELDNGIIISCSEDKTIKFWE